MKLDMGKKYLDETGRKILIYLWDPHGGDGWNPWSGTPPPEDPDRERERRFPFVGKPIEDKNFDRAARYTVTGAPCDTACSGRPLDESEYPPALVSECVEPKDLKLTSMLRSSYGSPFLFF